MNKAKRKTVIAGNWKMNMTPTETAAFIKELAPKVANAGCEVVLCVPAIDIPAAVAAAKGTVIRIGGENVHFEQKGAFTGEISTAMLKDAGAEYVIVGHSERRQYFGETDETVNKRAKAALAAGLKTIICVGETLTQREQGITEEVVSLQTKIALVDVDRAALSSELTQRTQKMLLLHMSRFGQSERAAPQRRSRQTRSAGSSAACLQSSTARMRHRQPPCSTAAP